jgi:hypothetical protein
MQVRTRYQILVSKDDTKRIQVISYHSCLGGGTVKTKMGRSEGRMR